MATPLKTGSPRSGRIRRWLPWCALALVAVVLYGADKRLKASETAGFALDAATWQLRAPDLPGAWARWKTLPAYTALQEQAPGLLQKLPLAVRKLTGVRPTPARLRLWLGPYFFASGDDSGWCLSLRPGIALRAGIAARSLYPGRALGARASDPPRAHAWHEGFFLLASSPAYLEAVMGQGRPVPRETPEPEAVELAWTGAPAGRVKIAAVEHLPFEVELPGLSPAPGIPLRLPGDWGETMAWAAVREPAPVGRVLESGTALVQRYVPPEYRPIYTGLIRDWWSGYCPFTLTIPTDRPWATALFALDPAAEIPQLEMAWAAFGDGPAPAHADVAGITQPISWNDIPGTIVPVAGTAQAWAAASPGDAQYLASTEQRMPSILAAEPVTLEDGVAALEIDWAPFAAAVSGLVRRAAREELLPGWNEDDISVDVAPGLDALQRWGTLEFRMLATGQGLRGDGYLARQPGSS